MAYSSNAVASLLQVTRTVPIVFVGVVDPVGAGYVDSLARPGGNITGFTVFEYSMSGKWLQLLKEIAPGVTRVAVLRDPSIASGPAEFAVIQAAAPSLGVELRPVDVRDEGEIERALALFAQSPNGGLIVTGSPQAISHRDLIIASAARHRLPAVYFVRVWAAAGGLISYGPDVLDQLRRAAGYVDRILKGDKPADMPVQAPTKYELVINLKTAKALGLNVPLGLQQRADEAAKVWRIGFLAGAPREANSRNYVSFVEGMRELGYVENKDFVIEWRSANEQYERFPELARELIRLKVDVIVTAAGAAVRSLQDATTTIPIVWVYSTDPVGNGFVAS